MPQKTIITIEGNTAVIVTHDGVKHWDGATKDSWFEQIAITAGTPE